MGQQQVYLDHTNVFVKYLPADIDDEGLRQLFTPYGEIISSKVMIDHQTGLSLGYGFVRFASPDDTKEAISGMTGQRINNKILLCKLSNSSTNSINPEPSTNLYIRPLPASLGQEDLRKLFGAFGAIDAAKVMVDKVTGESIQIGFVRFENQEDASAALNSMNGQKLVEDQPPINVKYAETEQQRNVRKSRIKPLVDSPPSPTYYFPPPPVVYSPVPYVPVSPTPYPPANYDYVYGYMPYSPTHSPVWMPYAYVEQSY